MINRINITPKQYGLIICTGLSLFILACDRQPGGASESNSGVVPLLVEQATKGHFRIERRFVGNLRAARSISVVVQEPGEVVSVANLVDGARVDAGTILLQLRSPALKVELDQARKDVEYRFKYRERIEASAVEGLESSVKVDAARAEEAASTSHLRGLEERSTRLIVRSSASGELVGRTLPAPGQWCALGLEVAKVIDPTSVVVEVAIPNFSNEEIQKISRAEIDVGDSKTVVAKVIALAPNSEPQRGGRILTLKPSQTTGLTAGANVSVTLVLAERENAVTVPIEALVSTDTGFAVYLAPAPKEIGRARRIMVVPGPDDGRRVVIDQGLEVGAWVALVGLTGGTEIAYWPQYIGVAR